MKYEKRDWELLQGLQRLVADPQAREDLACLFLTVEQEARDQKRRFDRLATSLRKAGSVQDARGQEIDDETRAELVRDLSSDSVPNTDREREHQVQVEHLRATVRGHAATIQSLNNELDRLRRWKEEQMAVTPPMQKIAKALDIGCGESIHDKILPKINLLKAELTMVRGELGDAEDDLVRARRVLERRAQQLREANKKISELSVTKTDAVIAAQRAEDTRLSMEVRMASEIRKRHDVTAKFNDLHRAIRGLENEINCRIDHLGMNLTGQHLKYVYDRLQDMRGRIKLETQSSDNCGAGDASPNPGPDA